MRSHVWRSLRVRGGGWDCRSRESCHIALAIVWPLRTCNLEVSDPFVGRQARNIPTDLASGTFECRKGLKSSLTLTGGFFFRLIVPKKGFGVGEAFEG